MPQTKSRPHVFQSWNDVSRRIRTAKNIRLFLDFDGTLAPICSLPKDVELPDAARQVLQRLTRHPRVKVALVSGRRNSALRKYVRVRGIQHLGLYGWEGKDGIVLPPSTRKALPGVRETLETLPSQFPGIRIENKGVSFGIHFRGAPPQSVRRAKIWARKFLARVREDFTVIYGNRAWEIVPAHVKGKGVALSEFMKTLPPPFLPIYIGDDTTDEPAFQTVRGGIAIRVGGRRRTDAHYRLKDPDEVRAFLERLEKELS